MQKILLCLVVLASFLVASFAVPSAQKSFSTFQTKYNKQYANALEESLRFEIFQQNIEKANRLNLESGTDAFGINTPFADLTQEEFESKYLMKKGFFREPKNAFDPLAETHRTEPLVKPKTVSTFDWSIQNPQSITPVKNQGECGSCWAFSATETLEAAWVLSGHSQVILGPQQLVDCTYPHYNGCNGGNYGAAWRYLKKTTGEVLEVNYPYTGNYSGSCEFNTSQGVATVSSVTNIANENALYTYVSSVAPASIYVDASNWNLYEGNGSIFPTTMCTSDGNTDHAVQVTGYLNINGTDVWNVRNSWGSWWGNSGYIYLPMWVNACSLGDGAQGVHSPSA